MSFQPGDFVRPKKGRPDRIRRVGWITEDADGKRTVVLNDFLEGWLVWNADDLVAVPQENRPYGSNKQQAHASPRSPRKARVH